MLLAKMIRLFLFLKRLSFLVSIFKKIFGFIWKKKEVDGEKIITRLEKYGNIPIMVGQRDDGKIQVEYFEGCGYNKKEIKKEIERILKND